MKLRILFTTALLMAVCSFCKAKEAYAVYDPNDLSLTFRYDDDWNNQPNSVYKYKLNTGYDQPGWIEDGKKFKRVVFTSSFADYRPTSTYEWFIEQNELTEFSGMSYLKTNYVENMSYMFRGCSSLTSLDLSSWNTGEVTNMSYMFYECSGLTSLNVSSWNTGKVTYMTGMFGGCKKLSSLDVSRWNTGEVTNMKKMFYNCSGLTSLNVSSWNTSKVEIMSSMFYNCSGLTSLNVSSWNTSKVTNMEEMFYNCSGLTSLNVSSWNTSKVENMNSMFSGCSSLTSLDVSRWNTGNVTDMSWMFNGCSNLTSLNLSSWNTGHVIDMLYMFAYCESLTSLNVSSWNTSSVTEMGYMFYECSNLSSLDLSGWDTGEVEYMTWMFRECSGLKSLNVSSWDTGKVKDMGKMFRGCSSLTNLDVSRWNSGKVEYMLELFYGCRGLMTIYVGAGWNTENVTTSTDMFKNCTNLVGGEGTAYTDVYDTSVYDDLQYAHVDGGEDYPGFFTKKNYGLQVSGRDVTSMNYNNILGNLSAIYDPRTHTLTLNGGTFGKTRQAGVYVTEDFDEDYSLNITLNGKNIMNSDPYYGISSFRTLWIDGNGSIEGDGIHLNNGNLWINDCQINVSSITANSNSDNRQYLWMQGKQAKISVTNNILWFDDIFLDDDDGFVFLQPEYGYYDIEDKCVKDNYGQEANGVVIASYGISTGLNEAAPQIDNGQLTIDNSSDSWYTIDGRKLSGKPTKKGIYVKNGRKVIF